LRRCAGLGCRLVLALAGAAIALTAGFAGVTFVRLVGLIVLGRGTPKHPDGRAVAGRAEPGDHGRAEVPVGPAAGVRRGPAWRSATIGVEGADSYTAFGYANPTRRVLAGVLDTRSEVRQIMLEENGSDNGGGAPDRPDPEETGQAAHLQYASDVIEVVEAYLYRPVFRAFMSVVAVAKRLQSGRLDAYLLYMLIALIAIIAVVTALA